jgi:regulator of cell morphogenesis and NO signaling
VINVQELEPRLRHQTIFNVFNTLKEGEHLTIHNNHDPMPVYYQLINMRGNIFSWEYLQKGPEWWDIKVTRQVPIIPTEKEDDIILNIPALEPQQKHQLIFNVFDILKTGDSFIIHNDHDPKPVSYQLKAMHGDVFDWEYILQGPAWWDIRVTRKEDTAK